jgi:trans-aconitate methyltransferase
MNTVMTYLLEQTLVYSLWQAPFAAKKLTPLLAHNDLTRVRRVLDVGCGPGTNTGVFKHSDYLGVDINPRYIASARRKHNRTFISADVTTYDDQAAGKFDFILVNSFLHHINDADANRILSRISGWLTSDGHIHIVEVFSSQEHSIAQFLANCDRGDYVRPLATWRHLFEQHLDIVVFETYALTGLGVKFWNMVYCKGRAKR